MSSAREPLFLSDSFFRSESIAYAEFARSLGGRARIAWELITGNNPNGDEVPAAPLNARGKIGIDLSGPPFGSALLHPVAVCGGLVDDADVEGDRRAITANISSTAWTAFGPWIFWQRPHARLPGPSIAPYDRAFLYARASLASGADVTLTAKLATIDLNTGDQLFAMSATATVSTTESAIFGSGTAAFFGELSGGHVACFAQFKHDGAGQSVRIPALSLLNVVKRSH